MFRMLIHPSSGACELFVELIHGLYCSGSMRVGVRLWFVWGGVVSGYHTKRYRREANHSHQPTACVKKEYCYIPRPSRVPSCGA